jgi:hypothetical protein
MRAELDRFEVDVANRVDDTKSGADRALGIVLMGSRVAEIGEHAVAHVFRDKPVGAPDDIGNSAVVGSNDLAQILGVEPSRELGRTDQIAEHHRQLPAFGIGGSRGIVGRRNHRRGGRRSAERSNCGEELAAMTDRSHADADQVVGRQLRQHFVIDIIVSECGRVSFEPQLAQPRHYVHAVILGSEERQPLMKRISLCPSACQRGLKHASFQLQAVNDCFSSLGIHSGQTGNVAFPRPTETPATGSSQWPQWGMRTRSCGQG